MHFILESKKGTNNLGQLSKIKIHKSGQKVSLHKPLLLLLAISRFLKNGEQKFIYENVEEELKRLLIDYGLKNTKSVKPEYPFIYLATNSLLWSCSVAKSDLNNPNAATRKKLLGTTGQLTPGFINFLKEKDHAEQVITTLLHTYWPEAYHNEILETLGIGDLQSMAAYKANKPQSRDKSFVVDVLDAYERKCEICGYSIRLGDALIGIDACHLKPIQHYGDDLVTNGLALCKMHHWALDRGAISINPNRQVIISDKLNGPKLDDFFVLYDHKPIHIPRDNKKHLADANIEYHLEYVFVK
jgi:putative restriction endonuclease